MPLGDCKDWESVEWSRPGVTGHLREITHYTKHRVLLWKRAWLRGERARLGGSKRVMLSLALAPPADSEVAGIVNLLWLFPVKI
jgi:hypothetical protein